MITAKEMYKQAFKAGACIEALEWLETLPENDNPLNHDHPQKAEWAFWYARWVIKDRWKEAEPYIKKNSLWAYYYCKAILKGPWPEAEPSITKDPVWSYRYNNFLKEIS